MNTNNPARVARQAITARPQQAPQQGGRQVRLQVAATAADNVPNYIPHMQDPDVQGLLSGLAQIQPALQKHIDEGNERDRDQARADAVGGVEAQKDSPSYTQAYFATSGLVKAQEDDAALRTWYQTEFDKDKGDIEAGLREQYRGRLKGITDPDYIQGYNKAIAPALANIRKAHLDYQRKAVTTEVESNAMKMADGVVTGYLSGGMQVPQEALASLQEHFSKNLGVSQQRFSELLFETVKRKGDEGNFAVYDLLKQDRPDGSPGLYHDPVWREKIDRAELSSYSTFETRSRTDRDSRQNEKLYAVFAEENPKKAQALFNDLKNSGLFTRADDLLKWERLLLEKVDGKPDARQLEAEGGLLAKVYQGSLSFRDILSARARGDITAGQQRLLFSEARRVQTENRQAEAADGKKADAIYRTHEFKAQEDYLQAMLQPRPGDPRLDPQGLGTEYDRAALASARLEMVKAVQGKTPAEIQPITAEIVGRYLKRRTAWDADEQRRVSFARGRIPFKNLQELVAAAREGLVSVDEMRAYSAALKEQGAY